MLGSANRINVLSFRIKLSLLPIVVVVVVLLKAFQKLNLFLALFDKMLSSELASALRCIYLVVSQ